MRRHSFLATAIASLIALALLSLALAQLSSNPRRYQGRPPLLVYCAAGLRPAIEPLAREYQDRYGQVVELQYGPSGGLESQINLSGRGDLFIPAAENPYLTRGRGRGSVADVIPLARMELVVATRPDWPKEFRSLAALLASDAKLGLASEQAAVGFATREVLMRAGRWEEAAARASVVLPTVTELAEAVALGVNVDAAFIWRPNAVQAGLQVHSLPELAAGAATVSAGILTNSEQKDAARRFATFLVAPDAGRIVFKRRHYSPIVGN